VSDVIDEVEIETLSPSGDGLAQRRHRTLSVPGTIPGERVRVQWSQRPGREPTLRLLDVLRPSPHRVTPRCPHVGSCGGCTWQHIAYTEQLRIKTETLDRILRSALRDVPASRPTLPGLSPDHPWGYRDKVHFVFGKLGDRRGGRDTLVMGHYARGSRRVAGVHVCPVHDERGNDLAFDLWRAYSRAGISAAATGARTRPRAASRTAETGGVLKSIAVRVGRATGEVLATLVVAADTDRRLRAATRRLLASRSDITGFHINVHPRDDAFVFGPETRRIAGAPRMREEVAGLSFLVSPTAFFQTNIQAAELLVQLVLDAIPGDGPVVDLYAGAGLFALPLVRAGHSVTAVEENRIAVDDAEASLRLNRLPPDRCRFVARPVEAALGLLPDADAVVLDPPREGCSAAVVDGIFGRLRPRVAVYVSCNPDTLARDLHGATTRGYRVRSVQPVDMFPHTPHIEAVVVLTR
jgi:23S rRNA (uracil1939-C5)-methyltransferase